VKEIYLLIGALLGVALLFGSNFLPFIPVQFFVLSLVKEEKGTRLFILDYHIHHWIFGAIFSIIGTALVYKKRYEAFGYFLYGLGLILIIDQLPLIISGEMHPIFSVLKI